MLQVECLCKVLTWGLDYKHFYGRNLILYLGKFACLSLYVYTTQATLGT